MEINWFPDALADLDDIITYIHAEYPATAEGIISEILSTVDLLRENPKTGRAGRWPNTRELVIRPLVVAYRQDATAVTILAVLHSARRWPDDAPDLTGI
jgi:toxin ParE1/3/4